MIYRISPTLARQQAQWFVLGLVLFGVTIVAFRDYRKLEQYRYIIVLVSLGLLILPRRAGHRLSGQRRLPGRADPRPVRVPAGGVRQGRPGHLPRQLPARHPPGDGRGRAAGAGRDDPADQVLRAGAGDLGPGDADHAAAARHRLVADVLRRTAGDAVRGDRPAVVRGRRACWRSRSAPGTSGRTSRTSTTGSTHGCTRSTRSSTTRSAAATSSPTRCSRRPRAGCSARVSARRR